MTAKEIYFIGVDVGTKSVRAALINREGKLITTDVCGVSISHPETDFYEQSSSEIWIAVCSAVKNVSGIVDSSLIKGIGFDATCSLVVLDGDFSPVSLEPESDNEGNYNIIMWMDHRAAEETELINTGIHEVLKYEGGTISIEKQIPKLLWLKKHRSRCWEKAKYFFDLPDFLSFKATGKLKRSLCSLACKWAYHPLEAGGKGWDKDFLARIGLSDLLENDCAKIGNVALAPGSFCGVLTDEAAASLGLKSDTPVGSSLIDAHAGGLALVATGLKTKDELSKRIALICGTSTCHMCVSNDPIFVPGVWGPYYSAMVPNYWLNEGGQSATGSLVDYIVYNHPAMKSCPKDLDVYVWLESQLEKTAQAKKLENVALLSREVHMYPDFHGNRSPLADASMKGMISGLTLENDSQNLAVLYLATIQAIAYGTKDIIEQLICHGHDIHTVLMCGGLSNSVLFIQTHADVLGIPVLIPENKESVLLGAAMLGATASGCFGADVTLEQVAMKMGGRADTFHPNMEVKEFHGKKYKVFKKMQEDQRLYRNIMDQ